MARVASLPASSSASTCWLAPPITLDTRRVYQQRLRQCDALVNSQLASHHVCHGHPGTLHSRPPCCNPTAGCRRVSRRIVGWAGFEYAVVAIIVCNTITACLYGSCMGGKQVHETAVHLVLTHAYACVCYRSSLATQREYNTCVKTQGAGNCSTSKLELVEWITLGILALFCLEMILKVQ